MTADTNHESNKTRIFISYSRKDIDFVRELHAGLQSKGFDTWVDWEGIPLTADWWQEIVTGIERSDAFAFVISPDSLSSKVCNDELEAALDNHKRLVPILHREKGADDPMPSQISSHNWVLMRDSTELAENLDDMVTIINTDLDWVKEHTRLLTRAVEWRNLANNTSLLLRGDDLSTAEQWLSTANAESEPAPTDLQISYIQASRRDATRRKRLTVAAALVALVIAVLGLVAFLQRNEAVTQQAIAEGARATAQADKVIAVEARNEADEQRVVAVVARATAEAAELEAGTQARNAATNAAALIVQPLVLDEYEIDYAIERANEELQSEYPTVPVSPSSVVAETMLDGAQLANFLQFDPDLGRPDATQVQAMVNALQKALADQPTLIRDRERDLGLLSSKICLQIPNVPSFEKLKPACQTAITQALASEDGWLSFLACSISNIEKLDSTLKEQVSPVCTLRDTLALPLTAGADQSGTLAPGENALFIIDGVTDVPLYVLMRQDGSGLDSYLDLYDGRGAWRAFDDQSGGDNDALLSFTPNETGPLYLIAHGYDRKTNGAYVISLSAEPFDIQVGGPTLLTGGDFQDQLEVGSAEVGELDFGDVHTWSFIGEAGQLVSIRMEALSGDLDSFLTLYGPDAAYIAEDDDLAGDLNALLVTELPESGPYTIEARALDPDSSFGAYEVSLSAGEDAFHEGEVRGFLEMGTLASAEIGFAETHEWSFAGEAGQVVSLAMVATEDSELDPWLILLSPNGTFLAEDDDSFGNLNSFIMTELPVTGDYIVLAEGVNEESVGPYALELSDASAQFSFGEADENAIFEDVPGFEAGQDIAVFDQPASSARQLIGLIEGDYVEVLGRSADSQWLYVASFPIVEGYIDATLLADFINVESIPLIEGTEPVAEEETDAAAEDTATEDTVVEETVADTSPVVAEVALVALASTLFAEPNGDAEAIVNVQSGDEVVVYGRSENGSWLYVGTTDAQGNDVAGFVSTSRIDFAGDIDALPFGDAIPEPGTETSAAAVEPVADGQLLLQSDVAVSGEFEPGFGQEWFFAGSAGDIVTIAMTAEDDTIFDTFIALYGPDGNYLAENDDGPENTNSLLDAFVLPADGIYLIEALAFDDSSGGPYTLTVSITTP